MLKNAPKALKNDGTFDHMEFLPEIKLYSFFQFTATWLHLNRTNTLISLIEKFHGFI